MTTWATSTPIRHPWFNPTTTKRKHTAHRSRSPSLGSCSRSSSSPPPTKRRKCSALESGFAHLTLNNSPFVPSALPKVPGDSHTESNPLSLGAGGDFSTLPSLALPNQVQEPSIPEVKMKSSSWYEPEPDRIVVTDLDSSSDEEELPAQGFPIISIPRSLLKQLSTRSNAVLTEPQIPTSGSSQALVVFRPLPVVGVSNTEVTPKPTGISHDLHRDEDAMDIEPW